MTRLLIVLAGSLFVAGSSTFAGEAPRPNIVLIMCDDMGWWDATAEKSIRQTLIGLRRRAYGSLSSITMPYAGRRGLR